MSTWGMSVSPRSFVVGALVLIALLATPRSVHACGSGDCINPQVDRELDSWMGCMELALVQHGTLTNTTEEIVKCYVKYTAEVLAIIRGCSCGQNLKCVNGQCVPDDNCVSCGDDVCCIDFLPFCVNGLCRLCPTGSEPCVWTEGPCTDLCKPCAQCRSGETLDPSNCSCGCGGVSCGGTCCKNSCVSCPPGQAVDPDTCHCGCVGITCAAGSHQDSVTCACVPGRLCADGVSLACEGPIGPNGVPTAVTCCDVGKVCNPIGDQGLFPRCE